MKLLATFLLAAIAVFAQAAPDESKDAPKKSALDKATLEAYLRNVELWVPQVSVKIGDPVPSQYMPGFSEVAVHLSFNGQGKDEKYYISSDGQSIVKGDVYNVNKSPFQANLDLLKTDLQPSYGTPGAKVVMVVFGDFECPLCKGEAEAMRKLIPKEYNDKVRVYFKDFPLESIHPWARPASIAGRCIFRQDPLAFWKYHDWIYGAQETITPDKFNSQLMAWAGTAAIDTLQLGRCVENKQTDAEVAKNMAEGRALGVDATPTLFLNGRKLVGNMKEEVIKQLIEIELDHQAKAPDAGEKCCTVTIPSLVPGK